jgi:hypothetical protein
VTVTDDRNVVVGVEVSTPVGVIHPDALGTHDVKRLVVEERIGGA